MWSFKMCVYIFLCLFIFILYVFFLSFYFTSDSFLLYIFKTVSPQQIGNNWKLLFPFSFFHTPKNSGSSPRMAFQEALCEGRVHDSQKGILGERPLQISKESTVNTCQAQEIPHQLQTLSIHYELSWLPHPSCLLLQPQRLG